MPKVSNEHLAQRRAQILDAARRCFVRNGFHATSMQKIFDESGLSAGAVYRYFASKEEMILAIAGEGMAEVLDVMSAMVDGREGGSLGEALATAIEIIDRRDQQSEASSLAIQIWAESLRNPALAAEFRQRLLGTRGGLEKLVVRLQGEGRLPADVPAHEIATVVATVIPGYIIQRTLLGSEGVQGFTRGLRALWT